MVFQSNVCEKTRVVQRPAIEWFLMWDLGELLTKAICWNSCNTLEASDHDFLGDEMELWMPQCVFQSSCQGANCWMTLRFVEVTNDFDGLLTAFHWDELGFVDAKKFVVDELEMSQYGLVGYAYIMLLAVTEIVIDFLQIEIAEMLIFQTLYVIFLLIVFARLNCVLLCVIHIFHGQSNFQYFFPLPFLRGKNAVLSKFPFLSFCRSLSISSVSLIFVFFLLSIPILIFIFILYLNFFSFFFSFWFGMVFDD